MKAPGRGITRSRSRWTSTHGPNELERRPAPCRICGFGTNQTQRDPYTQKAADSPPPSVWLRMNPSEETQPGVAGASKVAQPNGRCRRGQAGEEQPGAGGSQGARTRGGLCRQLLQGDLRGTAASRWINFLLCGPKKPCSISLTRLESSLCSCVLSLGRKAPRGLGCAPIASLSYSPLLLLGRVGVGGHRSLPRPQPKLLCPK